MEKTLLTIELIVSVLLALSILLQSKSAGMGSMGGEETENFSTKRGAEKFLHTSSVVLAIIWGSLAAAYPILISL